MQVHCERVGPLSVNCYVVWDDNGDAMIIDPGGNPERILAFVQQHQLRVKMVVNTHGHMDHIAANADILAATGAKLAIHRLDEPYLNDGSLNLSAHFGMKLEPVQADLVLDDGQEIGVGTLAFRVLHTPGHTPGGICLVGEDVLFSGDTLFAGSIGRSDLVGGDAEQLMESLKTKIAPLSGQLKVYPGHERATDLEHEKHHNPWLQRSLK